MVKPLKFFFNNRVRDLLEEKQLYPNSQHGFTRKRCTDIALTIIHETIAHHLPEKRQCYLVQRDISKAFAKVCHKRLKYIILHLNFPPRLKKFLCIFFKSRVCKNTYRQLYRRGLCLKSGGPTW